MLVTPALDEHELAALILLASEGKHEPMRHDLVIHTDYAIQLQILTHQTKICHESHSYSTRQHAVARTLSIIKDQIC